MSWFLYWLLCITYLSVCHVLFYFIFSLSLLGTTVLFVFVYTIWLAFLECFLFQQGNVLFCLNLFFQMLENFMVLLLHYYVYFCRFYSGLLWLHNCLLGFYVVGWSLYAICVVLWLWNYWSIFSVWYAFISLIVVLHFFCFQQYFLYWFFLSVCVGFVMLFRSLELFLSYAACFNFFYKGTSFALLGSAVFFVVV